ncbi:MAG: glycosyltransferase [Gammaproteobacteria bacterium]|nr:glycosyltransferase [Gammaproteobacteria bacterium]
MSLDNKNIRITAILPNYNDGQCLETAMDSLLNQTTAFDEIIIVDDGSTDSSLTLIQAYEKRYKHLHYVKHETNQGVCAALNTGLKAATGDFIMLCAADDFYDEHCVDIAKRVMYQHPHVGLICGDAIVTRFDLKTSFLRSLPYPSQHYIKPQQFQDFTKTSYVGFNSAGSMFINKEAIVLAGFLKPELKWHCDWLLYFVIALRQGIYYTGQVFTHISIRKDGYSSGLHHKKFQNNVMMETIKAARWTYPDLWPAFKEAALLPHYAGRYVWLFLFSAQTRSFLSCKLVWKIVINNKIITKIGRLFPYRIILNVRQWLHA